ncbi:hypothetical protein SK128_010381 [Halocaridina rubra]|uniref:Uncharacterized protein n=1 Tax=Halocaridina rubra TaxID=373956 RepID=A0AAN8WP54_HALRR
MQSKTLFWSFFALTWVAAVESFLVLAGAAALAVAGLAALKGAAIVGYAAGRHHRQRSYYRSYGSSRGRSYHGHYGRYRHYRSVEDVAASEASEDMLLSTIGKLDPNGCILKLLCSLQFKEEANLSLQESVLLDMFDNNTETLTSYNTAFIYASELGYINQDPLTCDTYFPRCPLRGDHLSGLLQQAWGCGFDLFGDDTEEQT